MNKSLAIEARLRERQLAQLRATAMLVAMVQGWIWLILEPSSLSLLQGAFAIPLSLGLVVASWNPRTVRYTDTWVSLGLSGLGGEPDAHLRLGQ